MTTGRINQVTIVSPGLAYRRREDAGEISKLLVGATEGAPLDSTVGMANGAASGNPLSPSSFTRAPSAARDPLGEV